MSAATERRIIYGGDEPIFGLTMDIDDLDFRRTETGKTILVANLIGEYEGVEFGLAVDLMLDDWERRETEDEMVMLFDGDIRFRPLGEVTDRLIDIFAREAHVDLDGVDIVSRKYLYLDCVSFGSDPMNVSRDGFRGKVFFGEYGDEGAAQIFLRLDVESLSAWFAEKDPEYRPAITRAFAALKSGLH